MSKNETPWTNRNQEPILNVLKEYMNNTTEGRLLEVGSGNCQHAIFFAKYFKRLHWVTSEMKDKHHEIKATLKKAGLQNLHGPELIKIGEDDLPKGSFDYIFTANTLHIMSWKENKSFFKLLGKRLREGALVFFYGPFNYQGTFTSESNQKFDSWLKENNSMSGIRNFEDVLQNMEKCGFKILNDHEMPANNRVLVFERLEFN